jgi:WD40 repeat protein
VAFSPDGETIAATGDEGSVRLLDVSTGRERLTLYNDDRSFFSSVRFSADGTTLAVAGTVNTQGPTILLWDMTTGRERLALKGHKGHVRVVCFSPDGETLVSGSDDNTIKVWETATGRLLETLEAHTDAVFDVSYSPDGKTLASASKDGTVKLWDVTSDTPRATFSGHAAGVLAAAFSPDGRTLASAGSDKTVKLWQVASGEELGTLTGHRDGIFSLAFSADGNTLASASFDGTIRLWRAATEQEVLLSGRASTIGGAEADDQRTTVTELSGLLAEKVGKVLTQADISLATSTGWALEDNGNHQLAATAFSEFAEAISASDDERFSQQAKTWEGIAKLIGPQ